MHLKITVTFLFALFSFTCLQAQVKTNFNSNIKIDSVGKYKKNYKYKIHDVPLPDLRDALAKDKADASNLGAKPFIIAEPVATNMNVVDLADWTNGNDTLYGRFILKAAKAKSLSINFNRFYLPEGTEMFIYNEDGTMITGAITSAENNEKQIWGSSIYKGDVLNIELKVPLQSKQKLILNISNVAYGFKDIFISKVAGFGLSGACNINVLCPAGNNWVPERNSVVYIARSNGDALCSGAMLMNTCATNIPYVLTANHCYNTNPVQDVSQWRIHFQAWSATCTPNQNSDGILFNGSTLRANWAPSDFCLVQLNQTPAANSGIHYAGWSRETNAAASGVGMHHPSGDVMKITTYNTPVARVDNFVYPWGLDVVGDLHWRVQWPTDNGLPDGNPTSGVTEGGSSGSPLFDQNHRIIGQLSGGPSACVTIREKQDLYGRFDNSWTGGGTNATRLSNWLDAAGTGVTTTNTTNVANLNNSSTNYSISGPNYFCSTTQEYSLVGGSVPPGVNVFWESSNNSIATVAPIGNGSSATVTKVANGNVTITASISGCFSASKAITVGSPAISITATPSSCSGSEYQQWNLVNNTPNNGTNWNWSVSYLNPNSDIVIYSPSSPSTWISVKGGGTVRLNYTDLCGGSKQDGLTVYSTCGGYYTLAVSPNPAQNNITVSLGTSDKSNTTSSSTTQSSSLMTIDSKGKTILSLFEMNTGLLVKQWKFNEAKNQNYNLSINGLRKGVYALQADRENHSVITKLIIE